MCMAGHTFDYAHIACEGSLGRARKFILNWAEVVRYSELLVKRGSEETGLSHALEDLMPFNSLRELIDLSKLNRREITKSRRRHNKARRRSKELRHSVLIRVRSTKVKLVG